MTPSSSIVNVPVIRTSAPPERTEQALSEHVRVSEVKGVSNEDEFVLAVLHKIGFASINPSAF